MQICDVICDAGFDAGLRCGDLCRDLMRKITAYPAVLPHARLCYRCYVITFFQTRELYAFSYAFNAGGSVVVVLI